MSAYSLPANEQARQQELESLHILDTVAEKEYDDISRLASFICNMPVSLITMVDNDRQWYKSHLATNITETSRDISFCTHAIYTPETITEIHDLRSDKRFATNPLVVGDPHVVFYAGAPLVTKSGHALGTICVLDFKPNQLSKEQKEALQYLSNQVVHLLELGRTKKLLEISAVNLQKKTTSLEKFAQIAAHDLKSPLSSMVATIDVLSTLFPDDVSKNAKECLSELHGSAMQLGQLIDAILENSRSENYLQEDFKRCALQPLLHTIMNLLQAKEHFEFNTKDCDVTIITNETALRQIMMNLITNSIKYCDKEIPSITIEYQELPSLYQFSVTDNGKGIEEKNYAKIFTIFNKLQHADRFGAVSTGIGLHTVQTLVEGLGGTIQVDSTLGEGTTFTFTIAK